MNTSFTATDHSLHPHCHARPPEPVLQQGQCLLLTLMSSIPMASVHGCHSVSSGNYEQHCFFQLSGQSMAVIEGTLVQHEFLPLPKDGHTLFHSGVVPWEMFQILYFMGADPLHCNFEMGSSCCAAMQSVTCKLTYMWVALAWTSVSSTCSCILSSASCTAGSWASALPTVPTMTPFRIDFTTSAPSFDATWLRASATALSLPYWYSMLNMNPASDSTHWCQVQNVGK